MEPKDPPAWKLLLMRWAEPQLAKTLRLLKRANEQLGVALQENTQLKNRNEELNVTVNRLKSDNRDLHQQVELLKEANRVQAEVMDRMERSQKDLMDRVEQLVARVVRLEVEAGRTPELPI